MTTQTPQPASDDLRERIADLEAAFCRLWFGLVHDGSTLHDVTAWRAFILRVLRSVGMGDSK